MKRKTARRTACGSGRFQELHDTAGAPPITGGVTEAASGRAPKGGRCRVLGSRERRSIGKWRLHLRQTPFTRDRSENTLSFQAVGDRPSGRADTAEKLGSGVLWRDRHLCS